MGRTPEGTITVEIAERGVYHIIEINVIE